MSPIGNPLPRVWKRGRLQGVDSRLPPSILKAQTTTPRVTKPDTIAAPYHWRPVQVKEHQQKDDMSYSVGCYVNTLTMDIANKTFEGATSHLIRLDSAKFSSKGSLWCYVVGGDFVICKGTVVGTGLPVGVPSLIGRLPVGHRPRQDLRFAAIAREAYDVGGHITYTSHLVTLLVSPDGYISLVPSRSSEGAVDLSAVRFGTSGGISLIDGVSLHTVDVGGTRMCCLQGTLSERFFTVHSHKALALLPESCRPPKNLPFVVSGSSVGGFHLILARTSYGVGVGGDLMWHDSIWNHDTVHLTGMMYEVNEDALQAATLNAQWTGESLGVFVQDFQSFLIRKFGSIENAWNVAFDTDGSGSVNFTEFGLGCKASGYVGNATRLWAALDDDRSGEISLDELGAGVENWLSPQLALNESPCGGNALDDTNLPGRPDDSVG